MTLSSKRELIQAIRKVYRKSTKAQKSGHLDHLELATGLKRYYLNRLLLSRYTTKRRKAGRRVSLIHQCYLQFHRISSLYRLRKITGGRLHRRLKGANVLNSGRDS